MKTYRKINPGILYLISAAVGVMIFTLVGVKIPMASVWGILAGSILCFVFDTAIFKKWMTSLKSTFFSNR